MPAPRLLLIKHSLPEIDPARPADEWPLGLEGRRRCLALAERLMQYRPQALFCSLETKARQTAAILADRLSLPVTPTAGLHEHARRSAGFGTPEQFQADVQRFFAHPEQLVFGEETARAAQARFTFAIAGLLQANPAQTLAVVAHGTVISLFSQPHLDPGDAAAVYRFWQQLGLPSIVVFELPGLRLLETIEHLEDLP
ncbi:MAG: histidine phosphatase family protein [Chloroflexota bacterium]